MVFQERGKVNNNDDDKCTIWFIFKFLNMVWVFTFKCVIFLAHCNYVKSFLNLPVQSI